MRTFYVADRRAMRWIGEWVQRGPARSARPVLAAQLRLLRHGYGITVARAFRDHLVWVGAYPGR
jgi:hypothetical protein